MQTSDLYEVLNDCHSPQWRKEKPSKKNHEAAPSLDPFSASVWGRRKNLIWVRFRISFPDFDEQVYTYMGYLRKDRQETEIRARTTSVVTDKGKENKKKKKKIIFWEETEEEKPRK